MPLGCALVVSLVCCHGRVSVRHEDWGLGRSDTISAGGFTAAIVEGDNFVLPDWRKLTEVCAAGACIRYHRHCLESAQALVCTYSWGRPGDAYLRTLRLSAASRGRYAGAVRAITLLSGEETGAAAMPLEELRAESESAEFPRCWSTRQIMQDCRA